MKLKEKYNVPFIATGHGYDVYDLNGGKRRLRRSYKKQIG
jgi:hypothetical protein